MNENIFWLGVNIYHEARGESLEGQIAVGHVVMNRAEHRKKTAKEIVLQPMQFSWHNGDQYPPIKEYGALLASMQAAEAVVMERLEGKTLGGADHYFADYISPPSWSRAMKQVAKIGKHIFLRS